MVALTRSTAVLMSRIRRGNRSEYRNPAQLRRDAEGIPMSTEYTIEDKNLRPASEKCACWTISRDTPIATASNGIPHRHQRRTSRLTKASVCGADRVFVSRFAFIGGT